MSKQKEIYTREKREARKQAYYDLSNRIDCLIFDMNKIHKTRRGSHEFTAVISSLNLYRDKINRDFERYERRARFNDNSDTCLDMQKALNRERSKREELEVKIKEASESSGLFIKYVREKLGFTGA